MYFDRVEIAFDAAHRLLNYVGKCASPHGHTYKAEIVVGVQEPDEVGLAIDFGVLRGKIKAWIDENWDHGFLLNSEDARLIEGLRAIPESKLYLFASANPSAEVMAEFLFHEVCRQFGGVVVGVRMWESTSQYAEFVPHPSGASLPFPVLAEVTA